MSEKLSGQARLLLPSTKRGLKEFGVHFSREFITQFYTTIEADSVTNIFINRLSPIEFDHLKHRQADHLIRLCDPTCDGDHLQKAARHVGRIHGLIGLDVSVLSQAYRLQADLITRGVHGYFSEQRVRDQARLFLHDRILEDLTEQMAGMEEIVQEELAVLDKMEQSLRTSNPLSDMVTMAFDLLMTLSGMCGAALTRPDEDGSLQVERYSGDLIRQYLDAVNSQLVEPINIEETTTYDPAVQAWHSGQIVIVDTYVRTDRVTSWKIPMVETHSVRSSVVIPIMDNKNRVHALCHLYHTMPGYFSGFARQSLLSRLQWLFSATLSRLLTGQPIIPVDQSRMWRDLLAHDGLTMYYQPIINLKTKQLYKVEALARLRTPEDQIILPSEFLPSLGHRELQVLFTKGLYQALQTRRHWEDIHIPVGISINFPTEGIGHRAFLREIRTALEVTHTDPSYLTIELLETEENPATNLEQWMADLMELGVRIAQDDLGSGYSSLLRLGRIAFDEIKVDQGLVRGSMQAPRKALEFIHHLTNLGHALGMAVIIEGVENYGLIEAAAILGADYGQGYGVARPMSAQAMPSWADQFKLSVDVQQPRTALGAFAALIQWDRQLQDVKCFPEVRQNFLQETSPIFHFQNHGIEETAWDKTADSLRLIARQGTDSLAYHKMRQDLEKLLMERLKHEAEDDLLIGGVSSGPKP